jgi:hypothetical protein
LIKARFPGTELQAKNTSVTTSESWADGLSTDESRQLRAFSGTVGDYQYSFRQIRDAVELRATLIDGRRSASANADEKIFNALRETFAWLNGGNPFATILVQRRDNRERFVLNQKWEGAMSRPRVSSFAASQLKQVFGVVVPFLASRSQLSEGAKQLLWACREANGSRSITLGALLQMSTLLEGLTGLVLQHRVRLSNRQIDRLAAPPGYSGRSGSAAARFYRAGCWAGFGWPGDWSDLFDQWKDIRNQLAHGNLDKVYSETGPDVLEAFARIRTGFDALMLRAAGYYEDVNTGDSWSAIR